MSYCVYIALLFHLKTPNLNCTLCSLTLSPLYILFKCRRQCMLDILGMAKNLASQEGRLDHFLKGDCKLLNCLLAQKGECHNERKHSIRNYFHSHF